MEELRRSLREAVVVNKRDNEYSIVPILPSLSTKPFEKVFARFHENVSILYADIVNFTPLTASMNQEDLVRLLNDLFGKFDEAVKVRFRIRPSLHVRKYGNNFCLSVGVRLLSDQTPRRLLQLRVGGPSMHGEACIKLRAFGSQDDRHHPKSPVSVLTFHSARQILQVRLGLSRIMRVDILKKKEK